MSPVLGTSATAASTPGLIAAPAPSGDTTGAVDTAAIQACIDAAASGDAGAVQLRAGIYWTTGILLRSRVTLRGAGWRTVIKAVPGIAGPVIGSDPAGMAAAEVCDLAVHGNRASATSDGIDLHDAAPVHPNVANLSDACNRVRNCSVSYAGRDGIVLGSKTPTTHGTGEGEHMASGCYVFGSGRNGMLVSGFDCSVWSCTVGGSVGHGVVLTGNNVRVYNTKAWYAGYDVITKIGAGGPASFDGFYIGQQAGGGTNAIQLSGCQSQDNGRYGLNVDAVSGVKVSGHAFGGEVVAGFRIGGGAAFVLDATLFNADRGYTPVFGVFDGNASGHQISIHADIPFTQLFSYVNGGSAQGCDIRVAASRQGYRDFGSQSPGATITPSPMFAPSGKWTLNGDATFANVTKAVPGMSMEMMVNAKTFTVTWGDSYTDPYGLGLPSTGTFFVRFRNIATNTDAPTWVRI